MQRGVTCHDIVMREPGPLPIARYDWEPSYVGIQTFLKAPLCTTPEDLRAGEIDVAVGGVPWDSTTTSRTGAHLGPQAIRRSDSAYSVPLERPSQFTRVDAFEHLRLADYGDAQVIPADPAATVPNVRRFVSEILEGGALPILLGGDHWVTWPIVSAVADFYGPGNVGLVHFDAHPDTAPCPPGSAGDHGTCIRQLVESGSISGEHIVQIGLRGYWPGPEVTAWMEGQGMRAHYMAEIEERGFAAVLDDAIEEAKSGPEHVFLTFDIDSVDPAFAPGTGAPEPGGLTSAQVRQGVRRMVHEVGIVGMDVVEVSPPYDIGSNLTALLAHRVVLEALNGLAMRRAGITEPRYVDPRAAGRNRTAGA
jgi:agmatinase